MVMQEMQPSLFIVLDMREMRPSSLFFIMMDFAGKWAHLLFVVLDTQEMRPPSLSCVGNIGNAAILSFSCARYAGNTAIFSLFLLIMQEMRPSFFIVLDKQEMLPSSLYCAGYAGNAAIFSFYCAVYVGDVAIFSFLCRICSKCGHLLFIVLDMQEMRTSSLYCAGYARNAAIFSLLCCVFSICSRLLFIVLDMQEMRPSSSLLVLDMQGSAGNTYVY
jgi:hypothetical protein